MPVITNGDFSDGLNGWTVEGAGDTAPTHDPVTGSVIFGTGNNDVQDGDRLSQQISINAGEEYTLTFTISEVGSSFGGFGLTVDLEDVNGSSGFTTIGSATVSNDETKTISITFTSPYDDPILRFRGQYGFGGTDSVLVLDNISVTCFVAGTLIETPNGPKPVESLKAGDLVNTLDNGSQPLAWVGSRTIQFFSATQENKLRPIRIAAGALGDGYPSQDLRVTRQHRVLVSSKIAKRMFGEPQVLVPAFRLLGIPGVTIEQDIAEVEYFHIMFKEHQIVISNGAPSESFFIGPESIKALSTDAYNEITSIFPELVHNTKPFRFARPVPKPKKQKRLVVRHLKNGQDVLSLGF